MSKTGFAIAAIAANSTRTPLHPGGVSVGPILPGVSMLGSDYPKIHAWNSIEQPEVRLRRRAMGRKTP